MDLLVTLSIIMIYSRAMSVAEYASSSYYIRDQICTLNNQNEVQVLANDEVNVNLTSKDIDQSAFLWFVYTNTTDDPNNIIKQLCPNVHFCKDQDHKHSRADEPIDSDKCCLPCGCSPDCHVIGNCCPDAEPLLRGPDFTLDTHLKTQYREECLYPEIIGRSPCLKGWKNTGSYLMIRTCPDNADNLLQDYDCMFPDLAVPTTATPVYSQSTGRSYANVHCAHCNHDNGDFKKWTGILICPSYEVAHGYYSRINKTNYLNQLNDHFGCSMVWEPPIGSNFTRCYLTEDLNTGCSHKTSLPTDSNVEEWCLTTTLPYGQPGSMYKNVFCFGCSSFAEDFETGLCTGRKSEQTGPMAFAAVINQPDDPDNIQPFEIPGLITDDKVCPQGYMYHTKTEECIKPSCPLDTIEVDDGCVLFYKTIKGADLDFQMRIRSASESGAIDVNDVVNFAKGMVSNENEDAVICNRITATNIEDGEVLFSVEMMKKIHSYFDLKDQIQMFYSRIKSSSHEKYKVEIATPRFEFQGDPRLAAFHKTNDMAGASCSFASIAVSNIQVCDAIQFPIDIPDMFQYKLFTRNNVTFKPSEYVMSIQMVKDPYIHICLETYEAKKMESVPSQLGYDYDNNAVITCSNTCLRFFTIIYILYYQTINFL